MSEVRAAFAHAVTASHAVTALCARAEVSREEAVAMLGSALRRGQIAHVENMREFSDNDKKLYYYTPRLPAVRPLLTRLSRRLSSLLGLPLPFRTSRGVHAYCCCLTVPGTLLVPCSGHES